MLGAILMTDGIAHVIREMKQRYYGETMKAEKDSGQNVSPNTLKLRLKELIRVWVVSEDEYDNFGERDIEELTDSVFRFFESALAESEEKIKELEQENEKLITFKRFAFNMKDLDKKLAEKDKEIKRLKEEKEYFISQNRLNSLEVIRLKKELDSRRTA